MHPHSLPYLLCCCKANLGTDLQKNSRKLLHYFLGALEVTTVAWMLRLEKKKIEHSPYKLGGSHCRFEKLWGKNSLNATLNGRSHYNKSPEPLIWGLFDHSPSECYPSLSLVLFYRYLCLSHSVSLSHSEPNCTQSKRFVQPLMLLHLIHYCTVQRAECLFHLVDYFRTSLTFDRVVTGNEPRRIEKKWWWAWTSLEIGRIEW